ncbi:hypothetical protein AAVH_42030, partial [Aphelenchoides avenae]
MFAQVLVVFAFVHVASAEQIEQCTCTQVERCRADARRLFEPCARECEFLLPNVGQRKQAMNCLMLEAFKSGGCFNAIHSDSCASSPGRTIDDSHTIPKQQFLKMMGKYEQADQANAFFACIDRCAENKVLDAEPGQQYFSCQEMLMCGNPRLQEAVVLKRHNDCRMEACKCWSAAGM